VCTRYRRAIAHTMPLQIVAVIIYRFNEQLGTDELFLEERRTPVGTGDKTIGFPRGKIEICATTGQAQETVMAAMQREIAEELVFRTRKGKPFTPCLDEPVATVHLPASAHLPAFEYYLFTTRIPRNVDIDFTESYKPRTRAHHWRRAVAVQDDFDRRVIISTKLLLSRVPFSPGRPTRASLATQLAPPLHRYRPRSGGV
jgi:8-oxo-dGTP pyrophosphatase MutT (NUDIX family)